jgi:hypothetical protein
MMIAINLFMIAPYILVVEVAVTDYTAFDGPGREG